WNWCPTLCRLIDGCTLPVSYRGVCWRLIAEASHDCIFVSYGILISLRWGALSIYCTGLPASACVTDIPKWLRIAVPDGMISIRRGLVRILFGMVRGGRHRLVGLGQGGAKGDLCT